MESTLHVDWWRRRQATPSAEWVRETAPEPADAIAFWALVGFTIVLVLAPQQYFPVLGQLRIALVLAAIAAGAQLLGPRSFRPPHMATELKITLLLLACAVLSIPASYWPGGSFEILTDQYLKAVIVLWLIAHVVCSVGRLRRLFWTLAAVSIPVALACVKDYRSGAFVQGRVAGYESGLAGNPNDLALTLNLLIPLGVALALTATRRSWRLAAWSIVALCAVAVLLTFSRGGFLTLVVEAVLLFALVNRIALKKAGAIVLVLLLALAVLPTGYGQRLSTIVDIDSDPTGSAQGRWRDIVAATNYIIEHPIIGAGIGEDVLALNEARGKTWERVHNTYLNYGVDMGIPGMALFIALVVTTVRTARRTERSALDPELRTLASGIRISLVGFIVAAFFHPVAYHFYFYYIAGLSVSLKTITMRHSSLAAAA
jgi:O-antigen ligase